MTLRIGCVPYLNAKPVVDWFHESVCDVSAKVTYAVPFQLASMLRDGDLDVALVSTVELFRAHGLHVVPNISISADGTVRSVRLFSRVPFADIRSVALDAGSLTSVALMRIILAERYSVVPEVARVEPDLGRMLSHADAALIIGRLDDFEPLPPYVLDLGEAWKELTGLPFCYAAWLARKDTPEQPMLSALSRAKAWGIECRGELVVRWSERLDLPADRVRQYLCDTITYDLGPLERAAMKEFQAKCVRFGVIPGPVPLTFIGE